MGNYGLATTYMTFNTDLTRFMHRVVLDLNFFKEKEAYNPFGFLIVTS